MGEVLVEHFATNAKRLARHAKLRHAVDIEPWLPILREAAGGNADATAEAEDRQGHRLGARGLRAESARAETERNKSHDS
jgi:hypothetical protein